MVKQQRLFELDALRGVAALIVCLLHFSLSNSNGILPISYFRFGTTGVDLFFMISGFVIYMSLGAAKNLKDFWFLRFNRLFPAYWLSIIIAVITCLYICKCDIPKRWNDIIGNLSMTQPVFRANDLVGAYWTLYIELCFYFFISLVWFFNLIQKIEPIIWLGLLTCLIINSAYLMLENSSPPYVRFFIISRSLMPLICYFGFFASGIIYYKIYTEGWNINRVLILICSFLLTIVIHNISGWVHVFLAIPERMLCEALFNLLFILIICKKASFLKGKWLLFMGSISYTLYLIHQSIGVGVTELLFNFINKSVAEIIGIAASIMLAALITYFFEKPVQKWLRHKYFANNMPVKTINSAC